MFRSWQAFIAKAHAPVNSATQSQIAPDESVSPAELEIRLVLEHLRQVRYSFNLSIVVVTTSLFINVLGTGLLWAGKTTQGTMTAAGGITSSLLHMQLLKEASDRLERSASASKRKQ
jgi:hypothetical protein